MSNKGVCKTAPVTLSTSDRLEKNMARDPLLVTAVDKETVTVQKVLHSRPPDGVPPKINLQKFRIAEKFLYVPLHRRRSIPPTRPPDGPRRQACRGGMGARAA